MTSEGVIESIVIEANLASETSIPAAVAAARAGRAPARHEILDALAAVLHSEPFAKAPRLCTLLRFLVEKSMSGGAHDTSEYNIGIEVFDRDPGTYNTGTDPIVRVQVGRLRQKLSDYYAGTGNTPPLTISIPVGSYMPVIERAANGLSRLEREHLLAVQALQCLAEAPWCLPFTQGLTEELSCQLFREFGNKLISHNFVPAGAGAGARTSGRALPAAASQVLEGSVRISGDRIRASLRLVDASAGSIAWSDQFDGSAPFDIALQEKLAGLICTALKHYFYHG